MRRLPPGRQAAAARVLPSTRFSPTMCRRSAANKPCAKLPASPSPRRAMRPRPRAEEPPRPEAEEAAARLPLLLRAAAVAERRVAELRLAVAQALAVDAEKVLPARHRSKSSSI